MIGRNKTPSFNQNGWHFVDSTCTCIQTYCHYILIRLPKWFVSNGKTDSQIGVARCHVCEAWWRHNTEALPTLLDFCEEKSTVTGGFPSQRTSNEGFVVSFWFEKRLLKPSSFRWFETPWRLFWCQCIFSVEFSIALSYPRPLVSIFERLIVCKCIISTFFLSWDVFGRLLESFYFVKAH